MKKSVILTATALGALFTQNFNEDGSPKLDKNSKPFGYLRVENPSEVTLAFGHNSGGVERGQSALVSMTLEAWEKVKAIYESKQAAAKATGQIGQSISGNVRIVESLTKELGMTQKFAGDPEKGGIACTLKGAPIYRKTEFDSTGVIEDILVAHDNVDAISALAKSRTAEGKTANALN